jgi:hypothetical protein
MKTYGGVDVQMEKFPGDKGNTRRCVVVMQRQPFVARVQFSLSRRKTPQ